MKHISAVPRYLGETFPDASPGLRFGLLLPLWEKSDFKLGKVGKPLNTAHALTQGDKQRMKALIERQKHLFSHQANGFNISAHAIAPFVTGLGNEHPLENGFTFLNPYGLPCLPGSGVKGVLREAARQLACGQWGETQGWSDEKEFPLGAANADDEKPIIWLSPIDVLFGTESEADETVHFRGVLEFWDVIPELARGSLEVDIMTPHQTHYYQETPQHEFESPHDSGDPNPIMFLTVPPGSIFQFHVRCNMARLSAVAPKLAADRRWKHRLASAFEHSFEWLGFGAKTAVGYGAMISEQGQQQLHNAQAQRQKADAEQGQVPSVERIPGVRPSFNRGSGILMAYKNDKPLGMANKHDSEKLLATLSPATQKKIKQNQYIRLTVWIAGGTLTRLEEK